MTPHRYEYKKLQFQLFVSTSEVERDFKFLGDQGYRMIETIPLQNDDGKTWSIVYIFQRETVDIEKLRAENEAANAARGWENCKDPQCLAEDNFTGSHMHKIGPVDPIPYIAG